MTFANEEVKAVRDPKAQGLGSALTRLESASDQLDKLLHEFFGELETVLGPERVVAAIATMSDPQDSSRSQAIIRVEQVTDTVGAMADALRATLARLSL